MDPQIGLTFVARTISAELDIAAALGVHPPNEATLRDILTHLAPFNTAAWNYSSSAATSAALPPPTSANSIMLPTRMDAAASAYTVYNDSRLSGDGGFISGATLAECEASCTGEHVCVCVCVFAASVLFFRDPVHC